MTEWLASLPQWLGFCLRRATSKHIVTVASIVRCMDNPRQQAFQKLRPPCVELSSVALKFRAKQTPVKAVLCALEDLLGVLEVLGRDDALDEKLAEYAFFPLSQVFNESQRLSSRCLEVAVRCLQILVAQGWRVKLSPEMGKQLLILTTLLAGGSPAKNQTEPPTDDLKVAAFDCISALTKCMGKLQRGRPIFDEVGARTIVDQSIYVLLEAITNSPSDLVQLAAAHALSYLLEQVSNRIVLASLLPRTVSALTKALQPSTQAKRTYKVLEAYLELLTKILHAVLNDEVVANEEIQIAGSEKSSETTQKHDAHTLPILDKSWLQTTSLQVKVALASVVKLRNYARAEVRQALARLATMVVEHCSKSLSDSVPMLVETLVVLANDSESSTAFSTLKQLAIAEPALAESLKSSLHKWVASLPRVMQGNDDRAKERILQQISTTFAVLSEIDESSDVVDHFLATCLVDTVAAAVESVNLRQKQAVMEPPKSSFGLAIVEDANAYTGFEAVILNHGSQKDSMTQLQTLITRLRSSQDANALIRSILDRVATRGASQLAAIWLALNFLRQPQLDQASVDEFLMNFPGDAAPFADSRPYFVSDLYSLTISELVDQPSSADNTEPDWRVTALALESLVLQADQLGASYRPELIDTLYPVLSLLGASQPDLRTHAMKALTLLAKACHYSSTSDMLIQNADYLINSIALRMYTFDISPQALQVLLMMVRLCGAKLIPYLDDLIGDIFAALDSFHGYPRLVELLFEVLGVVVDEGARQPSMTITNGKEPLEPKRQPYSSSTVGDIITDLRCHKARQKKSEAEDFEPRKSAPHRPWKETLDGPEPLQPSPSESADKDDALAEGNANEEIPLPEKAQPLSKPHALLLRVAECSPYHLSSPSPRVRLTVLNLLTRIAAPLSTDENTFLPLVNAIWPALVPRLFANSYADDSNELEEGVTEPVYTITAAASTVSALCVGAGDFMANRIEDMFPSLERMYRQIWDRVAAKRERGKGRHEQWVGRLLGDHAGAGLSGTVDLDIRTVKTNITSTPIQALKTSINRTAYQGTNSSDEQILDALIGLLVAILGYVRITEEMGDVMLDLLAPVMDEPGRETVTDALENWNADAVWLVREQRKCLVEGDHLFTGATAAFRHN